MIYNRDKERELLMRMADKEEILRLHRFVVQGMVNGLSHTQRDGRDDLPSFWRRRSQLFGAFGRCVLKLATKQDYTYDEKELKEIAEEGFSLVEEGGN